MRIAPIPKVAGGTTIGGLVAYGVEVLIDYGWDIKPSLAAWVVLLTSFVVAWLIPGEDGPSHGLPAYPADPAWGQQQPPFERGNDVDMPNRTVEREG